MTAMVCFRAGENTYAIPVTAALSVRSADGVVRLPSQGPDVIGVLPGEPPLVVISPLAATGKHVLVVTTPDQDYGLLVDEVTDVWHLDDTLIRAAPCGQDRALVIGLTERADVLVLLADPVALGALL